MTIDYFSGVEYQPLSTGDFFGSTTPKNVSPAVDGHEALDGQYDELWIARPSAIAFLYGAMKSMT